MGLSGLSAPIRSGRRGNSSNFSWNGGNGLCPLEEIRRAEARFAPLFDATLFWHFAPRQVRQLSIIPGAVLTGYDAGEQGCAFRLSFDYGNRGTFSP